MKESSLPADDALEQLAIQRAEQESEARMPETPEEMIAATLDPVTGCVDQILAPLSRLGVGNLSKLQDILQQVNARLLMYLKSEATVKKKKTFVPSAYARHVLSVSSQVASQDEIVVIADATAHIIAELNPLMHAAWTAYNALVGHMSEDELAQAGLPRMIEEFFATLDDGRVEGQRVFSLFGVLKEIAGEQSTVALLDARKAELPKEIVLTDPLGVAQKEYWTTRQRAYTAMGRGDVSLQALVSGRTLLTLNNLSELALSTHDEELKEAAEHVGFWLEGERMQVEGLNDDAFEKYVAGLHFGYGDPDVLLTLLNSLEIVKQKAPELYVRIMGRAPRPFSPTDARSDLFGNLVHAALYRSLHMESGKGTEGYQILQNFLDGLTHVDSHQEMIAPLSEEEIQAIGELIEKDVASGSFMAVAMAPMMFKEGRDAYMLGKLLERVSAENREGLLQELRNASPDEFVRLMRSRRLLPKGLGSYREHDFPSDIKAVLAERELQSDSNYGRTLIIIAVDHADRLSRVRVGTMLKLGVDMLSPQSTMKEIKDSADYLRLSREEGGAVLERLNVSLWKTTPSEKLLKGKAFYTFLKKITDRVQKNSEQTDATSANNEDIHIIFDILNVHPSLTENEWYTWFYDQILRSDEIERDENRTQAGKVVRTIFLEGVKSYPVSDLKFLRLCEYVFRPDEEGIKKILTAISAPADDFYRIILGLKPISEKTERTEARQKSTIPFTDEMIRRGLHPLLPEDQLDDDQKAILRNLKLLSKLFTPRKCADILDTYFARRGNSSGVDLFADMLSQEDQRGFLIRLCQNMLGGIRQELRSKNEMQKLIDEGKVKIKDAEPIHNAAHVNVLFVLLRRCAEEIPEHEEYLDLKETTIELGYVSNMRNEPIRRVRFDEEEKHWILEEGEKKLPVKGDVLNLIEMKKVLGNELDWQEIARE
ncbi:MAG: hypothetical protein AAB855_02005 [Patescibacteria group bacterium]